MSRAQVVLDNLLELGEGERAGAAATLAELFELDPALLTQALGLALERERARYDTDEPFVRPVEDATLIASAWTKHTSEGVWVRYDLLRGDTVGEVVYREGHGYYARARPDVAGREVQLGVLPSLAQAQEEVDGLLAAPDVRPWRLRPQPG